MTESPAADQPPVNPRPAEGRGENTAPPAGDAEHSHARRVFKALFIGLVSVAVSMAIPLLIVGILAFVAQLMISGH